MMLSSQVYYNRCMAALPATSNRRKSVVVACQTTPNGRPNDKLEDSLMKRRQWGVPMLLSGLVAAQVSFFSSVGPSVAEIVTDPAMPSIDWISESNAGDVIVEVEESELPQLEVRLGEISNKGGPEIEEAVAAAQSELQAIETEAAQIAEQSEQGEPSDIITGETQGLLNNITSLKNIMRGIPSRGS